MGFLGGLLLFFCSIATIIWIVFLIQKKDAWKKWLAAGIGTAILGGIFMMVGVGQVVHEVDREMSETFGMDLEPMSGEVYNQIRTGMSMDEVRSLAGEPRDTQTMEVDVMGQTTQTDFWYYGPIDKQTQIGFENGRVNTKASY